MEEELSTRIKDKKQERGRRIKRQVREGGKGL